MNLVEALAESARQQPDTIALKIPFREKSELFYKNRSFVVMHHEVDLLATYLFSQKLSKGKKVLILLPPGEDLLISVFALLRLGAIPVIIDPGMGIKNFIACTRKTQPDFLLASPKARLPLVLLKYWMKLKKVIFVSEKLKRKLREQNFVCHVQQDVDGDAIAAVLFTSGSTGAPKGAVYTYNDFNAQIEVLKQLFNIQSGEVDLPLLPVFSLYNPALGLTTVIPEMNPSHPSHLNPAYVVIALQRCDVTHSFGSPRLWTKIANYCEINGFSFPVLKRVFLAGAPVHPNLLKRVQALLPNGTVYTPYGATEALPIACISAQEVLEETYQQTLAGKGTCVGKLVDGVEVRILPISDEAMDSLPEEVPQGEIGEIVVHATYISKSYLNNPEATQMAKINVNGKIWHRMGDLGYKDSQGRLWFCGRKVERVVTEQKTYYTDCCEAIFNAHEEVFRSALIAFNNKGNVFPAMVIEAKQKLSKAGKEDLLKALRLYAKTCSETADIQYFAIFQNFPVDVRHNAKIHRLTLMKYFAKNPKKMMYFD